MMEERLTTARIRRDIGSRGQDEIFTTRQMLRHGPRGAVDFALYKMVKDGVIKRLARGVFVKAACQLVFEPIEIAKVKAEAFGKRIISQSYRRILQGQPFVDQAESETTFVVEGSSSSFWFGKHRIVFKSSLARKFALADTLAGVVLRALWRKGEDGCKSTMIRSAADLLRGKSRVDVYDLLPLLPAWLHEHFVMEARIGQWSAGRQVPT